MAQPNQIEWRFGGFSLSPEAGRLSSGGEDVALAQKSFEVLVHLVTNHDRFVSRDELRERLWSDAVVSDSAIASAVRDLRRALGDAASEPRFVATVRGRGMRFIHPLEEVESDAESSAWEIAASHFERALEALDLVDASRAQSVAPGTARPSRERSELMLALAKAQWSAGASEPAKSAFLEAAEVARASGDDEVLARAALGFVGRSDVTPGVNREGVRLLEEARAALGPRDSALHAEVLARLGTELYYDDDPGKSVRLTRDALAMAKRVGDPATLAYVATARHFSCQRPDVEPLERLELADLAISLTEALPPSDVLAFALQERMIDLFEVGLGAEFDECFDRYENVVESLTQPFFEWLLALFRGNRTLLSGNVTEAEDLAFETLERGRRIGALNAQAAFAGQLFAVRREQGRLHELAPLLESAANDHEALPIFRVAGAAIAAAGTDSKAAKARVDEVMKNGLDDYPRDQNWIATLGTLAPAVAAVGNERQIRRAIELLTPFEGRLIVVGQGAATHGAVSHHLGSLHAALAEWNTARTLFTDAEALHRRVGATLYETHSRTAGLALRDRIQSGAH